MNYFILFQDLMAQGAAEAAAKQPSMFEMLLPFLGMIVLLYFIMWRPQVAKAKEHRKLLAELKPGEEVVTSGGLIAKVKSVSENFINVEIAPGTVVKILKTNVSASTKTMNLNAQVGKPATKEAN